MFNDIKKTLSDLKINFDKYSNEKDYYDNGSIDSMLDEFKQMGYIYDKDGATWFNFSKLGKFSLKAISNLVGLLDWQKSIPAHYNTDF